MHSDDLDATIAFNGEIYNHIDMRTELECLGRSFQTHCDTEVVLNAYLEWGNSALRDCVACLPAIWVESDSRLVLARDRMGIKPLYYRIHEGESSLVRS